MSYDILLLFALAFTGLIAGWINTIAGGGSNLTLPMLMVLGLPPDVANGTNRVAVVLQALVGVRGFSQHGKMDTPAILPILIPCLLGSAVGAIVAATLPNVALKPLLLGTVIAISFIIIVRPSFIAPPPGTPVVSVNDSKTGWGMLFVCGVYGGFVQASVGFILLATLSGVLRYDLVRANALKIACTLAFTLLSLGVFIYFDQVAWLPGLVLGVGSMLGAWFSVKFAVKVSQNTIKWFLFAMTVCASVAAFVF